MMFAAVVGHCFGRATPSLCNAPSRQLMEMVRGKTVYRNRNAVQTNPATSTWGATAFGSKSGSLIGHRLFVVVGGHFASREVVLLWTLRCNAP